MDLKLKSGKTIPLELTIGDALAARRRGYDIGDFSKGIPQEIAGNPLATLEAARELLGDKIAAAGFGDFDELLGELEPEEVGKLVDSFRQSVSFFFPEIRRLLEIVDVAISEAGDEAAGALDRSGDTSTKPPES